MTAGWRARASWVSSALVAGLPLAGVSLLAGAALALAADAPPGLMALMVAGLSLDAYYFGLLRGLRRFGMLAAYRVADSPVNALTPLMVYLPFIVTIAQRYKRDAGIGTVIALMLPFVVSILIAWIILFVIWFVLGIPLGPGYPITL